MVPGRFGERCPCGHPLKAGIPCKWGLMWHKHTGYCEAIWFECPTQFRQEYLAEYIDGVPPV